MHASYELIDWIEYGRKQHQKSCRISFSANHFEICRMQNETLFNGKPRIFCWILLGFQPELRSQQRIPFSMKVMPTEFCLNFLLFFLEKWKTLNFAYKFVLKFETILDGVPAVMHLRIHSMHSLLIASNAFIVKLIIITFFMLYVVEAFLKIIHMPHAFDHSMHFKNITTENLFQFWIRRNAYISSHLEFYYTNRFIRKLQFLLFLFKLNQLPWIP